MSKTLLHPLVDAYLDELRRATQRLPRHQRAELLEDIRAHLEAGLEGVHNETEIRNLLESLGSPDDVAASIDVAPPTATSLWSPLALALMGLPLTLPGAFPWLRFAPVGVVLCIVAILSGVRVTRRFKGMNVRTWPATLGTGIATATLLVSGFMWIFLMGFHTTSDLQVQDSVSASASPSVTRVSVNDTDLQVRPVLSSEPTAGDCVFHAVGSPAAEPIKACAADGMTQYELGPARITGKNIVGMSAKAGASADATTILVTLDDEGAAALSALSKELSSKPAPRSQMAIVIRGEVQSAPTFMEPISGNQLILAVSLSRVQAQILIDGLTIASAPACPDPTLSRQVDITREMTSEVTRYFAKRHIYPIRYAQTATVLDLTVWRVGQYTCTDSGSTITYRGFVPPDATAAVKFGVELRSETGTATTEVIVSLAELPAPTGWKLVDVEGTGTDNYAH